MPVNNTTVPTSDNTGHQQHYAAGGIASGIIGTIGNIWSTQMKNDADDRRYAQAVRDNRQNARDAFARQQALQKESERYNSVQNKVSMLRQAGLNPALAYGDLGSSAVGVGSADQAAPASPAPAAAADMSGLATIPMNMSTMMDVQQKGITNKYLDTKNTQEIFKMIAETQKLLADTTLTEEQRQNLIDFRSDQLKLLKAQTAAQTGAAHQSEAQSEYITGAQTDLAQANANQAQANADYTKGAKTDLTNEQVKSNKTLQDLNKANASYTRAKQYTEENYNRDEIVSRTELNNTAKTLKREEIEKLDRENSLSRTQKNMIDSWVAKHGYDPGVAKLIYGAFDAAPDGAIKSLESWLDAGNWLPFVSNMVRNFTWKNVQTGKQQSDDTPPSSSSETAPSDQKPDVVQTVPSWQNFNKEMSNKVSKLPPEHQRAYQETHVYVIHYLNNNQLYQYRKDLYYAQTNEEFWNMYQKWYKIAQKQSK